MEVATENEIAVLGVDIFRIRRSGLKTEGYTNYDFQFSGDWANFVGQNNRAAAKYVEEHQFGAGYGYVLTTTSQREFNQMRKQLK